MNTNEFKKSLTLQAQRKRSNDKRTPEQRMQWYIKTKFDMELAEYYRILKTQNNVCAICKRPETRMFRDKVRRLAIDHCHKTNITRGLLCGACNTALGLLQESSELLQIAKDYIDGKHKRISEITTICTEVGRGLCQ